jgi:SnoaL-like polyketide cyclase
MAGPFSECQVGTWYLFWHFGISAGQHLSQSREPYPATIEGTHEGDLFGVPPTGRRVSIESMTVERVLGGKIRAHWRITDTLDMMQQLGATPTLARQAQAGVVMDTHDMSFDPSDTNRRYPLIPLTRLAEVARRDYAA